MDVGAKKGPRSDINITPLVDVVLVLLIIFMVTASFIVAPAVKVELPQVSKADEPPPRSLHFLVDQAGTIYMKIFDALKGNQNIAAPESALRTLYGSTPITPSKTR